MTSPEPAEVPVRPFKDDAAWEAWLANQLKPGSAGAARRRSASRATRWAPSERWAMDFMHDVLATGQSVRVFTLVDVYSREGVALDVARSFSGTDVARLLGEAGDRAGGLPPIIQCDIGLPPSPRRAPNS